jgi:hypothetical protein
VIRQPATDDGRFLATVNEGSVGLGAWRSEGVERAGRRERAVNNRSGDSRKSSDVRRREIMITESRLMVTYHDTFCIETSNKSMLYDRVLGGSVDLGFKQIVHIGAYVRQGRDIARKRRVDGLRRCGSLYVYVVMGSQSHPKK